MAICKFSTEQYYAAASEWRSPDQHLNGGPFLLQGVIRYLCICSSKIVLTAKRLCDGREAGMEYDGIGAIPFGFTHAREESDSQEALQEGWEEPLSCTFIQRAQA